MGAQGMPPAEVDIDEALVRALLADQSPQFADLPLVPLANGWDNVIFRLGDALTVRLPRRALAAPLVEHEQRWLPELAPGLGVPVPVPVVAGRPACGYPWAWSVCRWLPGRMAAAQPRLDGPRLAEELGGFLAALHRPAPVDAPSNPFRGVPLAERDGVVRDRLAVLADVVVEGDALLARWERLVATPAWPGPRRWLHGDLHPANILIAVDGPGAGGLAGVVDFGDLCGGDPATDLSVAWMQFDGDDRALFRSAAGGCDDDTWARAQAWAIVLGLAYLGHSADNPTMAAVGRRTLARVLAGPRPPSPRSVPRSPV